MQKSILVSKETHRRLAIAKMEMGFRSMDELLGTLISEASKARFLEASRRFKIGLERSGLSISEVTASSEAIRIELFRRWFEKEKRPSRH